MCGTHMCSMNACTCTSVPVHRHVSRPEMDIGVQHIEPYSSETGPLTEPEVSQQAPGIRLSLSSTVLGLQACGHFWPFTSGAGI